MPEKTLCPNCGSGNLKWFPEVRNLGGVQDGRIKLNETGVEFFLGCEDCSETIKTLTGEEIARLLEAQGRALSAARPFVKSWGELTGEEWPRYKNAIKLVDEALELNPLKKLNRKIYEREI